MASTAAVCIRAQFVHIDPRLIIQFTRLSLQVFLIQFLQIERSFFWGAPSKRAGGVGFKFAVQLVE